MSKNLLYLSRADVEKVSLDMPSIIGLVETVFKEKGSGKIEMPPKPGIHTQPDAFIHAMPAYIPGMKSAGVKWVGGYPTNTKKGLAYISGLLILNDPETGFPISVMDCTWITAKRTGAVTALSAKYLARKESSKIGILACGVQGRTNLEALVSLFPVKTVFAYDIDKSVQDQYLKETKSKYGLEVIGVSNPKEAVINSDIVVTSGPILLHPTPTINKDWLQPGGFGGAVDFDSYWSGEAMKQMDKISTDDTNQFNYYRTSGYFRETPQPYTDLGELVTGKNPGRQSDNERTLAINLGLAIDDMAIAPEIYRRAKENGIGNWLEL